LFVKNEEFVLHITSGLHKIDFDISSWNSISKET